MFPHQNYEERVVAFIDLLGFSEMVGQSETDVKKLRRLTAALSSLYEKIWSWEADGSFSSFAFTQFSDSIVISALADSSDCYEMLMQVLMGVMELVDSYDILVRGGIAQGKLIHDRSMLIGPAMVEAYHLESKKAVYPRIIIDEALKTKFDADVDEYIRTHTTLSEVPRFNWMFKQDDDGWFYLDYIDPAPEYNIELNPDEHLKVLDELVVNGLQSKDVKVRTIYEWLKKKVEAARIHQQTHPEDYIIE